MVGYKHSFPFLKAKSPQPISDDFATLISFRYFPSGFPFHVLIAVNKGFYNIKLGKTKSKEYKKEIIHCTTNEIKLSDSLNIHNIHKNMDNNYYIVFIGYDKEEINNKIKDLEGTEINVENYANFLNFDNLVKHFQIKKEKEINNVDDGINKAIYNRIATKELK